MDPLIITAAITGAELDKSKCPALPVTPEEQGRAAQECVEAGASVIHLHVRDDLGRPSQNPNDFKKAVEAIRKSCPIMPVIQFSTGGAVGEKIENRIAPLALKPDMGSLNLGTINFGEEIFVNTFSDMRGLAKAFRQYEVVPEYEIYESGHIDALKRLIKEGLVEGPFHCQFVLGVVGAMSGEIENLLHLVHQLPTNSHWGVAGIGRFELPLSLHAIAMGGNIRVGLEDNIYFSKGIAAKTNAELVSRVARISKEADRKVASISETRKILGLKPT